MTADYLDRLAGFAAGVELDALPAATVDAARLVLLDTLGAIVAGSAQAENRRLAELATARAPHGRATLLGHRTRAVAGRKGRRGTIQCPQRDWRRPAVDA